MMNQNAIDMAVRRLHWFAHGLDMDGTRGFRSNLNNVGQLFPEVTLQMVHVAFDYGLVPFVLVDDGGESAFAEVEVKWANNEPIPIWSGESDGTIWGSRLTNWLFRVWHDSIHCKESVGFGLGGEIDAAVHHMTQATAAGYPELAAVCWLEVAGQAAWHHANGGVDFPPQSFTRSELDRMGLNRVGWRDIEGDDLKTYGETGQLPFDGCKV